MGRGVEGGMEGKERGKGNGRRREREGGGGRGEEKGREGRGRDCPPPSEILKTPLVCGFLLTVAVPTKQVCSQVGDRCDQIMNDVCQ